MSAKEFRELFKRYSENPILKPEDWPYKIGSIFNAGAIEFNNEILLLVRAEDRRGYSHLTRAVSKDGKTNWRIDSKPTLEANVRFREAIFGFEDPRIVWMQERQEYIITCASFRTKVGCEPPGISLIATKDFSNFERVGKPLIPPNKDACLFPKTIKGFYALIHRPVVDGGVAIWVSFSPDLEFWGRDKELLPTRHRSWDNFRVGLGPQPIETPEGWLIIYHGSRRTASGDLYRVGLALLDPDNLKVIRRSTEWVFKPEKSYERVGDVDNIVFPCGAVVKKNKLMTYYGAADSVIGLATADLEEILDYLKKCPSS